MEREGRVCVRTQSPTNGFRLREAASGAIMECPVHCKFRTVT